MGIALGLASGCYSTKMMEFTYQELDSVKTRQQALLDRMDELSQRFGEEKEDRLRSQAEQALMLQELRELLEILSSRFEDTSQLLSSRRRIRPPRRSGALPAGERTGSAVSDSARAGAPDTAGVAAPSEDDSDAERLFKGSYMDLTLGNYDLAVQGFKNYLVRYPNAENLSSAHYYLGDSYYSLSRFVEAVSEYQVVIRDYSRSRFVPAAYLKSGFCYQKLDEPQLAERSFRELISLYPRTEEAQQARAALQDLGG